MSFSIVVGGVVRHIVYCRYNGQTALIKRDWQCTLITGGATMDSASILASLDLGMAAVVKDVMSEDAQYYGSQLYHQTPVGPRPRPESTTSHQGNGNAAAHALPSQDCGLLSLYTDVLGKTGQGRTYTPFPPTDALAIDGLCEAAFITTIANIGDFFLTPRIITNGGVTATLNTVLYKPGGDPPKAFTHYIARNSFATQRRRGAYGRLNQTPF